MKFEAKFNPIPVGLATYQAALVGALGGFAVVIREAGFHVEEPWAVIGLAFVAAVAERGRVSLGNKLELSISLIPTVFASAIFGPAAGLVVGVASFAGELPVLYGHEQRRAAREAGAPWAKWTVYSCIRGLCGGMAGLAAVGASDLVGNSTAKVVVATATAALIAEVLDVAFLGLTVAVRRRAPVRSMKAVAPVALLSVPIYAPLVALLGAAYRSVSPWTLAFFFIPALVAQRLFALYQNQRELADGLAQLNETLEQANLSFASALVATLDARDRYTAGHSAAVAIYARDIAARMGMQEKDQSLAHLCGLVHDIGKIGLPAGLLEKPGALTLDERREMQRHSEIGERILANVETYAEIASIVRHHHERMDGNGYPDGIKGDEIPLLARIIAVADAYNAMTSDRPYRDAMPTRVARLRLAQAVETQFDTSVVAAFEAILAGASEAYRTAQGSEFLWLNDAQDATVTHLSASIALAS